MPYTTPTNNNKSNSLTNRVNYNAREFEELKQSLVQYAKQYFPNSYQDFNESSPGMMLIDANGCQWTLTDICNGH